MKQKPKFQLNKNRFNGTSHSDAVSIPKTAPCIHNLFEAQVLRTPHEVALIFNTNRLTYLELNERANKLAHHLLGLGIESEALIGICVGRSVEMVVGILAILKAGGAYVPLDPNYPEERIRYMLADSKVSVLLTQEKLVSCLGEYRGKIVQLDNDAEYIAQEPDENMATPVNSNDLAYVIYTSGSTGEPKGVMITHENLAHYIQSLPTSLGIAASDRYLHTASISFSSSVRQMMLPLSIGASVVIATSEQIRDPLSLFELIRREDVTVVDFVPSFWRSCLLALNNTSKEIEARLLDNKLKLLLSASEPFPVSIPRELAGKCSPDARLINMYGQTETSGIISVHPINAEQLDETGIVSIGREIKNTTIYIVNNEMQLVPNGERGELCVGGPGVGLGYLNQPELTDSQFVKNPFAKGRLYKTGDLARYLSSGELEYLGRIDNQVKIRGFRVELGEIEALIGKCSEIGEVVVAAKPDASGDKRLAAYLVSGNGSKIDVAGLRSFLKTKLPDYMVPSTFVQLERMPLTPNGKIDRKALPEPERAMSAERNGRESSWTETEKMLAAIWSDVLEVDNIGLNDNFFNLGGHSLLAISMFAAVEETFQKRIPIATLFAAGTIARLAEIVDMDEWEEPESSLVPIQPNGNKVPFYCIHAVGGSVLFYNDLAKHLGNDQPFYGLQARRLGGRQVGHATIEEMAEFYVEEIKRHQPKGPYCLGGSSFGGLVAYEMARRFRARGDEVGLLALFDTSTPEYKKHRLPDTSVLRIRIYNFRHRMQMHWDNLILQSWSQRVTYILNKARKGILTLRRGYRNRLKTFVRKFYLTFKGKKSIPENYIQIEDQLAQARKMFLPKPYLGKATLFRASIQPYGLAPDRTLGWDSYVDELEIHDIPGHHTSIVSEPYVRKLAERLKECLRFVSKTQNGFVRKSMSIDEDKREFSKSAGFEPV